MEGGREEEGWPRRGEDGWMVAKIRQCQRMEAAKARGGEKGAERVKITYSPRHLLNGALAVPFYCALAHAPTSPPQGKMPKNRKKKRGKEGGKKRRLGTTSKTRPGTRYTRMHVKQN